MIRMLTDLFDKRINGAEKVMKLKSIYGLKITREVESEVKGLCTYADAIEIEGMKKTLIKQICRKLRKGKDLAQIADEVEEEESNVKPICDAAADFAPEYDEKQVIDAVFKKMDW